MMLKELIHDLPVREIMDDRNIDIQGVTYDSRQVKPGFLFAAIPGQIQDGHAFIPDAIKKGATAVMTSKAVGKKISMPLIIVEDVRRALAQVAARFYEEPSRHMRVIGITGTNGKTTLTYLLESILLATGRKPGVIGTINYRYGGKTFAASHTTPESADLQKLFSEMRAQGTTDVVMEVSSHALSLDRVKGVHFDVGVFTNLSQDHLDYHHNLDEYFQAKLKLFSEFLPESLKEEKFVVVNMEDARGEELLWNTPIRCVQTGLTGPYEVSCQSFQFSEEGIDAQILIDSLPVISPQNAEKLPRWGFGGESGFAPEFEPKHPALPVRGGLGGESKELLKIHSSLIGRFNLENILLAVAVAQGLGIEPSLIKQGIESLRLVPGRMEKISNSKGFLIFVDYAHTPEALAKVGENLRRFCRGRLITVFGCGGDRDRSKRPLMGLEVAQFSDRVILTSDNPRSENPETILDEIMPGLEEVGYPKDRVERIVDREKAIQRALELAREGDLLLIAGKGHEDYQVLGNKKIHFSDREVVEKWLT